MLVHSQIGKSHILKYLYGKQLEELCAKSYSISLNFYFSLPFKMGYSKTQNDFTRTEINN